MSTREDGELSDESPKSRSTELGNDDLFVIDKECSGIVPNEDLEEPETSDKESGERQLSNWAQQLRKRVLGEPEKQEEDLRTKRRRGNACFNCRGDHIISDCPEPRDFNRIRRNRLEFQSASQSQSAGRISKTVESVSKFKPGRLSQSLRTALRLGPDDIPDWVYRMRRMGFYKGYPPGHLKMALRQEYSTLKIFSDDQEKNHQDDEEHLPAPIVDQNQLHFYMGFNKTYGALRDHERGQFAVPPFETFCEIVQKEVTKDHEESEKIRIFEDRIRRQKLLLEQEKKKEENEKEEEEEEVFVIDRNQTELHNSPIEKETTPLKDRPLGESVSQLIGTPVVSLRDKSGLWVEQPVASLEAFAVGIVPFEAREEETSRGTFKKIMSTLRGTGQQ